MPIYEYRCAACGFQKEYLQKMSDAPLTDCPECGKASFSKMVTAAGFQLKGSGWYVTDFRQGSKPATGAATTAKADGDAKTESKSDAKAEAKTDAKSTTDSKPAATAPAAKAESSGTAGAASSTTSSGS
jgi:putative FmdB family regulatory protein